MSCFDVANEYVSEDDARWAREGTIVVGSSMEDRICVVDRGIVDRPTQNARWADKAVVVDALVDAADVAVDAADAVVVVSRTAENPDDHTANQRFAEMGRARVVVVVWDPLSRSKFFESLFPKIWVTTGARPSRSVDSCGSGTVTGLPRLLLSVQASAKNTASKRESRGSSDVTSTKLSSVSKVADPGTRDVDSCGRCEGCRKEWRMKFAFPGSSLASKLLRDRQPPSSQTIPFPSTVN
jgi:hypothetical protein